MSRQEPFAPLDITTHSERRWISEVATKSTTSPSFNIDGDENENDSTIEKNQPTNNNNEKQTNTTQKRQQQPKDEPNASSVNARLASKLPSDVPDNFKKWVRELADPISIIIEQETPILKSESLGFNILSRTRAHLQFLVLTKRGVYHAKPQGFFQKAAFGLKLPGIVFEYDAYLFSRAAALDYTFIPTRGSELGSLRINLERTSDTSLANKDEVVIENISTEDWREFETLLTQNYDAFVRSS